MPGLEIYFFIRFIFVFFIVSSLLLMALTVRPFNRYGLVNAFSIPVQGTTQFSTNSLA